MTSSPLETTGLPFADPVLIVATATLLFLVVPLVAERLRVPGVVGLILAGAAIGPHGLGILERDATIVLLGTVGLLYLMLLVGLELDVHDFARYRRESAVFGLLSFLVPAASGTALALALGYAFPSALLVGSAFSSHTLLAYPVASRLGIVRHPAVTTTLGGTIVTEVLALLLLAVVVRARGGPMDLGFWTALGLPFLAYVAAVLLLLPRLGRWFFRRLGGDGATEFVFVLVALFWVAYLAHFGGVEPIVGALLAGLALNRLIPAQGPLMSRIHFAGNALFIPFFLLSVGMLVDVRALDTPRAWLFSGGLAAGVVLTKGAAAWVASRVFGFGAAEAWVMFGLSVPHAAGTLAIVLVGYDIGLLDQTEVNGVVLMILVTCVLGPWVVQRHGRTMARRGAPAPRGGEDAGRRVLVGLADPAGVERLLDLAFLIRERGAAEPVRPLVVVPEAGAHTAAAVTEAERLLDQAVRYAAAADVAAEPVTRVDGAVPTGIVRAVEGTRSTALILGWDGERSPAVRLFGSVLDAVLRQTRAMVLVARAPQPLNVAQRIALLVPPASERHPGYAEAAQAVHRLAAGLGVSVAGLAHRDDSPALAALHERLQPRVPVAWQEAAEWGAFVEAADALCRPDTLVVLVGARPGTLAWHPRLHRLPAHLAEQGRQDLLAIYPPQADPGEDEPLRVGTLLPDRVVQLGATSFVAATGRLLGAILDEATARELTNVVVRNEEQFSSELVPGIVVPHVRLRGLPRPLLVLGLSAEGVRFPRATTPARLVFLLVSPAERAEEHLQALAEIARTASAPEEVAELLRRTAPGARLDWLGMED